MTAGCGPKKGQGARANQGDVQMPTPLVSVIVPTRNRARLLQGCVERLLAQEDAPLYEVIVVDNGSTDETPDLLVRLAAGSDRLRAVREERAGISHARNAGVALAQGELLFFTDDDVLVPDRWVETGVRLFQDESCDALGGPVLPVLEGGVALPAWFGERLYPCLALRPPIGGNRWLTADDWMPYGASMAFRREMVERAGGFDPALGRRGDFLGIGEESVLFRRVLDIGGRVLFSDDFAVEHRIGKDRLRKAYFRKWMRDAATQRAIGHADMPKAAVGPWMARRALERFLGSIWLRARGRERESFEAELEAWEMVGLLRGWARARA